VINLVPDLAAKAPLASPALTGTPTAPTATAGTNTTQVATTAYVQSSIGGLPTAVEPANTVLAGPTTGAAAAPTFRALVAGDIPGTLNSTSINATAVEALTINQTTGNNSLKFSNGNELWVWYQPGAASFGLSGRPIAGSWTNYIFCEDSNKTIILNQTTGIGAAPAAGYDLDVTASAPNGGTAHFAKTITIDTLGSTSPTPTAGDNSTKVATTAFVTSAIAATGPPPTSASANTVYAGPASGAAAVPAFRALVSADIPASVALTGTPTAPTPAVVDNSTKIATTAFVMSGYRLIRIFMITAGGTYTPTAGTRALYVECTGGQGGGGGCPATTANASTSGGGGGGAYAASWITTVAASYAVTIGAGGSGGAAGANAGGNAGDTLFGSVITAKGGLGGSAGTAPGTAATAAYGGATQTGSVGDLVINGSAGTTGVVISGGLAALGLGGFTPVLGTIGSAAAGTWIIAGSAGGRTAGDGSANVGTAPAAAGGGGANGVIRVWEFM
jgi:hypothetical protein